MNAKPRQMIGNMPREKHFLTFDKYFIQILTYMIFRFHPQSYKK